MGAPIMKCPSGNEHERLIDDPPYTCADCGSEIVHAQAIDCSGDDDCADYAVWCINAACVRHACCEVGDMECPRWAHGPRLYEGPEPADYWFVGFRFCCRTADQAGAREHPERVIRATFPNAEHLEPVPIADCWMFNVPRSEVPAELPGYFVRLDLPWGVR